MEAELSIIIVHYRNPEMLRLCLDSIRKTVKDISYEVILVDSFANRVSRDEAREQAKKFSNFQYLPDDENTGYSKGVNRGIGEAKGKHILILNYDVILEEGCVRYMLEYMQNHPDIGILGPKVLNFNGTHQRTFFRFYTLLTVIARRSFLGRFLYFKNKIHHFMMLDTNSDKIQTPDWLMGSIFITSLEALKKVGSMDERFFFYFEDVDLARRFWHNGYKVVYYPKASAYHYHGRGSKSKLGLLDPFFNFKTRWHISSAMKYYMKYRNLANMHRSK